MTVEPEVADVIALLRDANVPFWIAGGFAIDLFVGTPTRPHDDIDVQIVRGHDRVLASHLAGWDFQIAHAGSLTPWTPEHDHHTIWCRPSPSAPWCFELLLADVVDDRWTFRRDPRISRPLAELGSSTASGIPFVRPEIQLLFKSKQPRPKDQADFDAVLPRLDPIARTWLVEALSLIDPSHAWLRSLTTAHR